MPFGIEEEAHGDPTQAGYEWCGSPYGLKALLDFSKNIFCSSWTSESPLYTLFVLLLHAGEMVKVENGGQDIVVMVTVADEGLLDVVKIPS